MDRRALVAASLSLLLGTAAAVAQTAGSTYGADAKKPSAGSTSTTSSTAADTTQRDTAQSSTSTSAADQSATTATGRTTATDTAGGATTMTGREKLGWMERRFVNKVADSGTTEIGLAKLAVERASNPEVKSFAQKLVDDHTKVSEELKTLAGQKGVKLDDEDLGSDRAHKRMSKKSGTEFDQEFVEHMIDSHENSVKMFEKASMDAKDQDLKSFAAKHVDHLREHLRMAQSLRSTIMPTGRDSTIGGRASTSSSSTDATTPTVTTPGTTGELRPDAGSTDTTRRNNNNR